LEALLGAERMTARVDLVRTDEEDSAPVQLWIYKGSKPPREEDEDFAARSTDNELHARVMAELYRANRDSYPDAVVIYFLGALPGDPEGAKLAFADFGLGSQRSALDRLNETIHEIQECRVHQEWDPPEDGAAQAGPETCDVCPFRWSCPKANVGPPEFEGVREP
jgi:rubredoxin